MKKIKNIVFGCTSSIGMEISKKLKKNETLLTSRKKMDNVNWLKKDLNDNNFKNFPKVVDKIFFMASPYYLKKNLKNKKKNIYINELYWLKKILNKIKFNQIIYISSPSIYIKGHPIGKAKIKCERYIMKIQNIRYQIWRPYNLIGEYLNDNLSDHFHNMLIKKILINKKKYVVLDGNPNDLIGYNSTKNFVKLLLKKTNLGKNLILDYKNIHQIKLVEILTFFRKFFDINFKYRFKHKERVKKKFFNNSIYSNENSISILKKYYREYKNEKKM